MEYTNSRVREIIAEYIHSERDRQIMTDRLVNNISIERLSEIYVLSVSQIKRIIQRDSRTIFKHFEPPEI